MCLRRLDRISTWNTKFSIFCLMISTYILGWGIFFSIVHRTNFFASRPSVCGGWLYEVPILDLYKWCIIRSACPQVFSSGGTCTLLPSFLGVHQNFGGAMYPLTLHLGVQRKWTAFSPRKVVHHAVFCKYYAELAKTFFLSDIGSDRNWGSV